jgi:hypothetical protein
VAGLFKANMGQTVDVTTQTPDATPAQTPSSRMNADMQKRYGIRPKN